MRQIVWMSCLLALASCRTSSVRQGPLASTLKDDAGTDASSNAEITHHEYTYNGVTSSYRLRAGAPLGGTSGQPLLVFFHGNLGSNFGPADIAPQRILAGQNRPEGPALGQPKPTLDQLLAETGDSSFWRQFVLLAILAPTDSDRDYKGGKVMTWGSVASPLSLLPEEQLDLHADFAQNLIQSIVARHGIDSQQVYLVGQSGGSLFLSNTFIPKYGSSYRGGAVLLCGGEAPRNPYRSRLESFAGKDWRWHFHTTSNESEHIAPLITAAHEIYAPLWAAAGAAIGDPQFDGDGKHCLFSSGTHASIIRRVIEGWHTTPKWAQPSGDR